MEISLGFGHEKTVIRVPDERVLCVLHPASPKAEQDAAGIIRDALANPIGCGRLREKARAGQKVAIVTSDITRPCPTKLILPEVVRELNEAGIPDRDITVVFGLGIHREHTADERRNLAGDEMYARLKCVDSDPQDTVRVGVTTRGTPVDVFRTVVEADFRICFGNIDPHYFAGYSGGGKAIMPGVCGRSSIQANHSRMLESGTGAGRVEGNPVREDIDEAASLVGVDFIVNVILNESKQVVGAVAGDFLAAHRYGCRIADGVYKTPAPAYADIVVASCGGHPKDINMYQAQKGLENAANAVKPGGILVLVASCAEGYGEDIFEKWLNESKGPDDVIERIKTGFELGGHKAAAIARVVQKVKVFLVSNMPQDLVRKVWMDPYASAQEALDAALRAKGPGATVTVMPYAGSTLPEVAGSCRRC